MDETKSIDGESPNVSGQLLKEPDAIRFSDLLDVLFRRKLLVIAALLLGLVVSLTRVLAVPDVYRFSTKVELGQSVIDTGGGLKVIPVDNVDATLAKINDVYIPAILDEFAQENASIALPVILASNPKGSRLIAIETKGVIDREPLYLTLLSGVADRLVREHETALSPVKVRLETALERAQQEMDTIRDERIIAIQKNSFKQRILEAKNRLQDYEAERKLLDSQYQRVNAESDLVSKQLAAVESAYQSALKNREDIGSGAEQGSEPRVLLLMLESDMHRYQQRVDELNARLRLEIPDRRQLIEKNIEDNRRAQEDQHALVTEYEGKLEMYQIDLEAKESAQLLEIRDLESNLAELQRTRVVYPAARSLGPAGPGPAAKIAVGIVFGLILGLFAAFIAESVAKRKGAC